MAKHIGWVLWLASLTVASSHAVAGEAVGDHAGRARLERCAAQMKQVHVVKYKADYKGTGWVAKRVAAVTGTVILGGRSSWDIDEYWCDVVLNTPDSDQEISLTCGSDGDLFYLIDPKAKMVYADMDPAVLGSQGRNVRRVILREFTAEHPLKEILEAKKIELQGTEIIGGEPCDKIEVIEEDDSRSVWSISQKDHLPRRLVRYHNHPEHGEGTTDLTLHHVEVDPSMGQASFALVVPAGYKKTDDFAP